MADAYQKLFQSNPSATTLTDAYTVPGGAQVVSSSIIICNRSATATSFRVSHAVAGAADDNAQYLFYDTPIAGNETQPYVLGVGLQATDKIRVYATLATLSFNAYGVVKT